MVPSAMLFGAIALGGMAWLALGQWLALPPFPLWLLLAYYVIVVGGWLVNGLVYSTSAENG